jgi:4-amino-4-deoxy-L-arabinose transferase-like glycosyltransferase
MSIGRMVKWIGGPHRAKLLLGVLVLSAILLFFDLGAKSMWIDEYNSVQIAAKANLYAVTQGVLEGFQRQPPAYFWLLHLWTRVVGTGDAAVRVLSVLMGLGAVLLTFVLGRQLDHPDVGLVASYLVVISPTFVLYARMARYYMPTLLFGLLSCCLFLALTDSPRSHRFWLCAAYILANVLLMLSSYVAGAVLLCQLATIPFRGKEQRSQLALWLTGLIISVAIVGAWFVYALPSIASYPLAPADLATGLSGYAVKLIYPLYSFAVGETLFPWRVPAILGGLTAFVLFLVGIARWRHRAVTLAFVLTGLFASLVLVVLSTIWFVVDVPFVNIPSRVIFALPFLSTSIAAGIAAVPTRWLKLVCIALLTVCAMAGLSNYYRGLEFHNPIYAVPMKEVVTEVRGECQAGDVIVSEFDTGFGYYYRQTDQPVPLWVSDTALALLQAQRPGRVWLITFGRDASRFTTDEQLQEWLQQEYHLAWERGYVEQDPLYRRVKEKLLHRPAYRYKLLVQRYEQGLP